MPVFEKLAREKVSELLVELDNWLSPYSSEGQQGDEFERVGLSVFQFIDPLADKTRLGDQVASEPKD